MTGVGSALAILFLAATPGALGSGGEAAKAVAQAGTKAAPSPVDIGRKWGIVTSVRRSPERNRAVGGAPNSFHLHGRAIDIARRPGVRHVDIDAAYRKAGFRLIESLDEGDHSHFAFGLPGSTGRPAEPKTVQLAANDTSEAACASGADSTLNSRRRPDRWDGCPDASEPSPRLKPLRSATE